MIRAPDPYRIAAEIVAVAFVVGAAAGFIGGYMWRVA
jgi:hypothetical protein